MRTIALIADYGSVLFFHDAEGRDQIDEATLPISTDLKRQLDEYYKHYSDLYLLADFGEQPSTLDKRLLDDTGFKIWRQLRKELALFYRVIFYSFEFAQTFNNPQEFIAARALK